MKELEIREDLKKVDTIAEIIETAKKDSTTKEIKNLSFNLESLLNSGKTLQAVWKYFIGWLEERSFQTFLEFKQFHKRPSVLAE